MSPAKALFTLLTLLAVPLPGYFLAGSWWGALVGLLGWLFVTGYTAQKNNEAAAKGGGREKGP